MNTLFFTYGNQIVGFVIALLGAITAIGAFAAGRVSYRKTMLENAKIEAKSWETLYLATKEQNEKYERELHLLKAELRDKDIKIGELNGKIDVIVHFMKDVLAKDLSAADALMLKGFE